MSELYPPDIELNDLSGTADSEQEILYIPVGHSPYYTSFYKMLYRLCDVARRAGDLRVYKDGDLTYGVRAGRIQDGTNTIGIAASEGNVLLDNSTNYIYYAVNGTSATLTVGAGGYPSAGSTPYVPLASITCAGGSYSFGDITDSRGSAFIKLATTMSAAQANSLVGGVSADALHKHSATLLTTAETDTTKVLQPDGIGGVYWGTQAAGESSGTGAAPVDAAYLTLSSDATLTNERSLTFSSSAFSVSDGGPGGTYSVNLNFGTDSTQPSAGNHAHGTATTSAAGLLPTLDGSTSHFLNGAGGWSTPAGGGSSTETLVRRQVQLPLTATSQAAYTCPTSYCAQITINLANLDSTSQCAMNAWIQDFSGSATAQIANGLTVNKNNTHIFGQKINLETGDKLLLSAGGPNQFDAILSVVEKLLSSATETWKMTAISSLGTSTADIVSEGSGKVARFVALAGNILNTTAVANITFKVNDLSTTQTLTLANQISISRNQYMNYQFDSVGNEGPILESGDSLQALANSTGAVSLVVNMSEWNS